jgi:pyruvate kinase
MQTLDDLIVQLDDLLDEMAQAESDHADAIGSVAHVHVEGAVNLVHYLALRAHDRRELQNDLMDLGATSLATTEANVQAKVRAARHVLAALAGRPGDWDLAAINKALDGGDEILAANTRDVLGPTRPARPTRIMVTLPSEAATDQDLVDGLVRAGMDLARINCAHDDELAWTEMARNVRAAAAAAGRPVLVSMDLPGPKLRTGPIADGPAVGRARVTRDETGRVTAPATLWLTSTATGTAPAPVPVPSGARPPLAVQVDPGWLGARRSGDVLKVQDARGVRRHFTVTRTEPDAAVAEGAQHTYIAEGAALTCRASSTPARGIAPIPRRLTVAIGDRLVLTTDLTPVEPPGPGQVARIGCTLPEAITALRPGDPVLLDDGVIGTRVETTDSDQATLLVTRTKPGGQKLGAEKGINLPDTVLAVPALTTDDEARLPVVVAQADLVAISFIRTPADVEHLLQRLYAAGGRHLGIVLKIETRQGFENLPAILLAAMRHPRVAVMIARGDLAVEVGYERLAEIPRQILALCEAAHIPAILATQVLETLAKTGQPSRAEITDAAAAQRAECVMLNKGPHILQAITTLDDILARMDQVQRKSRTLMRHIHSWDDN